MRERFSLSKVLLLAIFLVTAAGCTHNTPDTVVELFSVYEITLNARNSGENPYVNGPSVSAEFIGMTGEAKGKILIINGFWDGGDVWRIRFAPLFTGEWSYRTTSADRGLDGKKGYLTAVHPGTEHLESNELYHGFLEKNDTFSWKLSDGTPFFPVGETQWSFSEEFSLPEWKEWMDVLHDRKYNTFMGCAWLGKYERIDLMPFENRDPSTDKLQTDFFRDHLDGMVQYANSKGIMMGIVIGGFPDNSQWFRKFRTIERSDRWFKYIIARYAAYNVRWGLFGELNEAVGDFALEDKSWQWVGQHYAKLVKDHDPYIHPVGSHNTRVDTSAAGDPNIDFIEVQEGDRLSAEHYINALNLRKWNKPVWYEEYWYEMDGNQDVGIQNTHRNFVHAMAFPTMGSLMRNHSGINTPFPPEEAVKMGTSLYDYLMKNDTGIIRMSYFSDFYKPLINYLDKFIPSSELAERGFCGKFGNNLAVFLEGGGTVTIDMKEFSGEFKVILLDIKTGEIIRKDNIRGGAECNIDTELQSDAAILILNSDPG